MRTTTTTSKKETTTELAAKAANPLSGPAAVESADDDET
jgi:hypothetical protein